MGYSRGQIIPTSVALVAILAAYGVAGHYGIWTKLFRGGRGYYQQLSYALFKFQYLDRIGSDSIRLLKISDHPTSTPELTIRTFPLSRSDPYIALSYTWGDPDSSGGRETWRGERRILLNGRDFMVQANLFDALVQLAKSRPGANVWIDAISINQECVQEVEAQIGIMDAVYSDAYETILWVGPSTDRTERALSTIQTIANMSKDIVQHWLESRTFGDAFSHEDAELLSKNGLPLLQSEDLHDLASIYGRKWFTRLWVVQELALSRNPTLVIGPHQAPWSDVGNAALCFGFSNAILSIIATGGSQTYVDGLRSGIIGALCLQVIKEWASGDRGRWAPGTNVTLGSGEETPVAILLRLLVTTCSFQTSLNRDRVYGVLALLQRITSRECQGQEAMRIVVDYETPDEILFRKFWIDIFNCSNSLLPLSFVGIGHFKPLAQPPDKESSRTGRLGLASRLWGVVFSRRRGQREKPSLRPSWLPSLVTFYSPILRPNFTGEPAYDAPKTRRASPDNRGDFEIDDNSGLLRVTTWTVSDIEEVGPSYAEFFSDYMRILEWFTISLGCGAQYRYTGQSVEEALWRTLILDQDADGRKPGPEVAKSLHAWSLVVFNRLVQILVDKTQPEERAELIDRIMSPLRSMLELDSSSGHFPAFREILQLSGEFGVYPQEGIEPLGEDEQLAKRRTILKQLARYDILLMQNMGLGGLRLARTRAGHLALVPAGVCVGDEIMLLRRHPVPFVLRRVEDEGEGNRYSVVGDCYVHGIMFGEAVEDDYEWPRLNTVLV